VIIVDDPHDITDALEQIESTIETFNTTLMTRLNHPKTGRVLIVAHRVHERDLSSSLLRKTKWKHVVLPMEATRDQTYETPSGKWRRRKGELLRPDAFDREDVDELRASLFNPDFDMLFQQDFDFQALPAISAEHFPTFTESMPAVGPVVLSVDPGITNRQTSAYSVIQAWCLPGDGYYLLDQFREQCNFTDLRHNLRRFRKIYRPVAILIERAANGHALISDLSRKYSNLMPIDPDGRSKSARLRVHAETIIGKRVHLPAGESWLNDYVAEFVEFPHGKFTDQVDATTQFLDHAGEFAGLEPTRPAGLAAWVNSGGGTRTISSSNGRERGLAAVVDANGRPRTGRPFNGTRFIIEAGVKY
jgi:phage terminase large subunit-like protein